MQKKKNIKMTKNDLPNIMKETVQRFPKLHRYFTIMAKVYEKAIHLTELLKVLELGNRFLIRITNYFGFAEKLL